MKGYLSFLLIRNEALDGASRRLNEEFDRISKYDTGGEYVIKNT